MFFFSTLCTFSGILLKLLCKYFGKCYHIYSTMLDVLHVLCNNNNNVIIIIITIIKQQEIHNKYTISQEQQTEMLLK